jgi:hypothetical protein
MDKEMIAWMAERSIKGISDQERQQLIKALANNSDYLVRNLAQEVSSLASLYVIEKNKVVDMHAATEDGDFRITTAKDILAYLREVTFKHELATLAQ